jgi:hypothetical protein
MTRSLSVLLASLALAACVPACASSDPSVSGVGLFNRRNVFKGDTVTISLPADMESGDTWKITRFDSVVLRPQPGSGEFRNGRLVFRFTAAVPGTADLEFQRIRGNRSVDERRTYRVIVRDRL